MTSNGDETMTKYVRTTENRTPGKATIYRVGVFERGQPGLAMQQEFYGLKNKKRAEDYAAWLLHLLNLEIAATVAAR
jgi:hypothetical protein